ncbi:MAG: nucleotide sugar dehydrogenase [Firmicutes bacterium]|nr:nucleotide sugar dehydrogenase [Bacillota bacterium]
MSKKKICIMGLGYIGLPTAAMFATHGHQIIGVDINQEVITALNEGRITINEPYLDIMVQAAVASGNLVGRLQPEEADVFIIAVPTPITEDKRADMSYVIAATEAIVPCLREGNAVVLESTSPTGTVAELMVPILEKSGLVIGEQLYVAHSPERVLPGKILIELVENTRIVGGINRKSAEVVRDLYKIFVRGEIFITDATTAEMCKMMENTYRDVNIALANELAIICERAGINAWEVIELCNKHPRVNLHQPGPGVGGHCIAIDPWFIVEKFPKESKIIKMARDTNDSMPHYVYEKIEETLKDVSGMKTVTVLGITYKPDVDDLRESPILHLIELLKENGNYAIKVTDPYVKKHENLENSVLNAAKGSDLLLLGVHHQEYKNLDLNLLGSVMRNRNIIDTRNITSKQKLEEAGFNHKLIGNR